MAHPILMPKPGQMTEECILILWHKEEGDPVHRGDVLFEIETDKCVDGGGDLRGRASCSRSSCQAGETVPVNTVCGWIGQAGEAIPDAPVPDAGAPRPAPRRDRGAAPTQLPAPRLRPPRRRPRPPAVHAGRGRRSSDQPARQPARGRARHRPARRLTGTGPDGRIVERDVQAADRGTRAPGRRPRRRRMPARDGRRMARSRRGRCRGCAASSPSASPTAGPTTPHFTVTVAVDMTQLLALRAELKAAGHDLTVTDFVLAATAETLAEFPDVNSRTDGVSVWPRQPRPPRDGRVGPGRPRRAGRSATPTG